jgi:gliding motility-associated-like protein
LSGLTYEFTITTYTKASSIDADRAELEIKWGDGTTNILPRTTEIFLANDIKLNKYKGVHTYLAPSTYIVSMEDPNRIENIINMATSVNVLFYIEDTLIILNPNLLGLNNSPQLLNPPIDFGNVGQVFVHNPNAYDPDGDSLSYAIVPPLQTVGAIVPGYASPALINPGVNNQISINPFTGELIWDSPQRQGIYNIAILITEFRNGQRIGTVLRDLQIIVEQRNNRPPIIQEVTKLCKIAGDTIHIDFRASDPDIGQIVKLSSNGAPYILSSSPADFYDIINGNPSTAKFNWVTNCTHLQNNDYQIIVKAEDNAPIPLVDLNTILISVLAPSPKNLSATYNGISKRLTLQWDSLYACSSNDKFLGFSIWKKKGCGVIIDTCNPNPANYGYTKIGETKNYSFSESIVSRGNAYSYLVVAEFGELSNVGFVFNKFSGYPSEEACVEIPVNVPVIYNVDVRDTHISTGQIDIEWSKPKPPALDTILYKAPYAFELYRLEDGDVAPVKVVTLSSPTFFGLNDTSFLDKNLNTEEKKYTYYVIFISNNSKDTIGDTDQASSVFLNTRPSNATIDLSWDFSVPWVNDSFVVFRFNPVTLEYDSIAITTEYTYKDTDLQNDSNYCYKIKSIGEYTIDGLKKPLVNYSQISCSRPRDTLAPCPPNLALNNFCIDEKLPKDSFVNYIAWSLSNACNDTDIVLVRLWYKARNAETFVELGNFSPQIFSYIHPLDRTLAGCYTLQLIDRYGNTSFSDTTCTEDCPFYKLPNTFTPNGDGKNDFFTPIIPYGGVTKIEMKIFTRWGVEVFSTSNPDISWDGRDYKGNEVPEAVYFYVCKPFSSDSNGMEIELNKLSGYIQIIR